MMSQEPCEEKTATSLFAKYFTGKINRRDFLYGAGGLASLVLASPALADKTGLPSYPFTLGVASGDPTPDSVVLWTRLAPNPTNGGWNTTRNLAVQWVLAADPALQNIVQRGSALATPTLAHSIHVELSGLKPFTEYYYQFTAGDYKSPVGRTKTAPAFDVVLDQLRFAFVCCNDYQNGYFAAYKRISEDHLDLVVHVGDYIYEYDPSSIFPDRLHTTPTTLKNGSSSGQLSTLSDYRNRHAQYKTDTSLQAAHHSAPWIVTPDDHEVENNYANLVDEIDDTSRSSAQQFALERANGYQAYYEHQPLRMSSLPIGPDMQLYRNISYGGLLNFFVLDTRQYRTEQTSALGVRLSSDFSPGLPPGGNPAGTLMGAVQENWLFDHLSQSTAVWNVVAQQVMMARFNFGRFLPAPTGPVLYNMDQWDGYGAARQRLLDTFDSLAPKNFIVLSGDIHSAWATNLLKDFDNPASRIVATEFVCTSITSAFLPPALIPAIAAAATATPWIKFFNGSLRGYCRCTVTPSIWQTEFVGVACNANGQVADPNAPASVMATRTVRSGAPGS